MVNIPKDFVAFDLETTGFTPPCRTIPWHITNINGIDQQVCLDSVTKNALTPILSAADMGSVALELMGKFNLIFY